MDSAGIEVGYEQTPSIASLATALAAAQDEMENAVKDSENTFFSTNNKKASYADLASVRAAAKPIYKHGLSVVQQVVTRDAAVGVRTVLAHKSGEWMASQAFVKPDKAGPQAAGSVITYLRRYMLAATLGIAQEDDDGNAGSFQAAKSSGNGHAEPAKPAAPPAEPKPADKPASERKWMIRLQKLVGDLELGKAQAAALKGKPKEDFLRDQKIAYLRWCTGRAVSSTLDLTDAEADLVIRRAEQGEVPNA